MTFIRVPIDRVLLKSCNLKSYRQTQDLCSNPLSRRGMDSTQELDYRHVLKIQEVTTACILRSMMTNRLLANSFSSSKDKELGISQSRTIKNGILFKMKINLSSLINSKRYRGKLSIRRVISRSSYQRI